MTTQPTPEQVLAVVMPQPNDAGAHTIRDYLVALLATLWEHGEGFGGKRPFGNSAWQYDLYFPLVEVGYITGSLDEEGFLDDCDNAAGHALITTAIEHLGATS